MQRMGLQAIYPGPNLSKHARQHYIALFQDTPVQISMDGKGVRWTTSSLSGYGAL